MGEDLPFVDIGESSVNPGQLPTVQEIACGFQDHTCVLIDDGDVRCWGSADKAQIGSGGTVDRGRNGAGLPMPPPNVDLGTGVKAAFLTAGPYSTCAKLTNGGVKCWGYNYYNELGNGCAGIDDCTAYIGNQHNHMGDYHTLAPLACSPYTCAPAALGGDSIAFGYHSTCMITDGGGEDGYVRCWGYNHGGQNGHAGADTRTQTPNAISTPGQVAGTQAVRIASYTYGYCALLIDDSVSCWGASENAKEIGGTQF